MQIDPIPAFADNYIWALHTGGACAVVDPGDAAPVIAWCEQRALSLVAILITHHHPDHVGGIERLRRRYGKVPVMGPAREAIPERTRELAEGDEVSLGELGVTFQIWDIPGHTAGHIAYVNREVAFVGDTLFAGGCGRVFDGTIEALYDSLQRLATLPDPTQCYCAHEYTLSNLRFALAVEPDNEALVARAFEAQALRERGMPTVPFTLPTERATNPFLRVDQTAVRYACERHAGRTLTSPGSVFAHLRAWKNEFRG